MATIPSEPTISESERAELEALRAEVQRLRAERAAPPAGAVVAAPAHRGGWLRWTAVAVLLVLAGVLMLGSVLARYVRAEILDTDKYVATVTPLGSDPAIQAEISTQVSDAILERIDLETVTAQALATLTQNVEQVPAQVQALAPLLASQGESFVRSTVDRMVTSPTFEELWIVANRQAHKNLVAVLTGEGDTAITADANGQVTLSLGPMIDEVSKRLSARGFTFVESLPSIDPQFVLFTSQDVVKAQRAVAFLNTAANVLPWLSLLVAAGAVWAAPRGRRRRAVVLAGVAYVVAMAILAVGITVGRSLYLSAVPSDVLSPSAATALIDAVLVPLRTSLRAVFAFGVVVVLAAYLTGPSRSAVAVRGGFNWLVRAASRGHAGDSGRAPHPFEIWVARLRWPLIALVLAGALAVLVFSRYPSGTTILVIALVAAVLVIAIQVVSAPARGAATVSGPGEPGGAVGQQGAAEEEAGTPVAR
ncbi:hypothetical protein [Oerskovia paurometabola]|uniref:Integral membrane protein n=1 Tax=Oerskovia paurometabola TaxID=162170 RepID=A0ABW1X7Z9_9CELL|nr:hypothetical protein [Oerskovia paurometabola]MBM7498329.1 hypothetical protein [Oerskovia paurometabola]